MTDAEIVRLYFDRDEEALAQTKRLYGSYCLTVSRNILRDVRDAEECVNDALLASWRSIPPQKPENLKAYLGKLTRELAIDRLRIKDAKKRGESAATACFEELEEVLEGGDVEEKMLEEELSALISRYLRSKDEKARGFFIRRYWYCDPIEEIARRYDCGKSKVKMTLMRMRAELCEYLKKEGYNL